MKGAAYLFVMDFCRVWCFTWPARKGCTTVDKTADHKAPSFCWHVGLKSFLSARKTEPETKAPTGGIVVSV